jgi:hypothetical protein
VYDGYKNSLMKEYKTEYLARNAVLRAAFWSLDEHKRGHLDIKQVRGTSRNSRNMKFLQC